MTPDETTRANTVGHISWKCGRVVTPASLSSIVDHITPLCSTRCSKTLALMPLCAVLLVGCVAPTARTTQLAQLLTTNAPCRVRLQPAWTGDARHTVRTGYFTNADSPELERLQCELQFDRFRYADKPPDVFNLGPRTISKGDGYRAIHTFRASLPTDAEITAATTVSALECLLGRSQGVHSFWGSESESHSTAGWTFFTLNDGATVETLSVFCKTTRRRGDPEWRVDSLKVTRGIAKPKAK